MFPFRKSTRSLLGSGAPALEFDSEEDRNAAARLLELIGKLVREAEEHGHGTEELHERDMVGMTMSVLDPPHAKAARAAVEAMRGEDSEESPSFDQTWDRDDLREVAEKMRGLKEQLKRGKDE